MELDTLYIKSIKTDGKHNYIAEIEHTTSEQPGMQTTTEPVESIAQAIDKFIDSRVGKSFSLIVLIVLLAFMVYKLCERYIIFETEVKTEATGMAGDTIYGHNWAEELKALMAKGDYDEAVVLCYLHLLETLEGRGVIAFMVSKTPQMFLNETEAYTSPLGDSTTKDTLYPMLQNLTSHYLRIRYGHRKATEKLAKELIQQDATLATLS